MDPDGMQDDARVLGTHWGTYVAGRGVAAGMPLRPFGLDPDPSPIGFDLPAARQAPARILRPSVRRSVLESRADHRDRRGAEPFVEVDWDTALDLVAGEIDRVRGQHGNSAIYGGSYGWASAGRFHHAQSQIHRFLNCAGGYTRSVQNYSFAAAAVMLPHIIGSVDGLAHRHTTWRSIRGSTSLVVLFGGLPIRNGQVDSGGIVRHRLRDEIEACKASGTRFVLVSPIRQDADPVMEAEWLALRPATDVALMLGLAHVLIAEGLHDEAFLARCTVGFERLRAYVLGESDGCPKTPEWASAITQIDADAIRALARDMAANDTFIMVTWSLQRARHGEQPIWMAVALAALLGGIGLPGRGVAFGHGSMGNIGYDDIGISWPSVPQGVNPVPDFIPVARIADMLLNPGEPFDYDGQRLRYPDIRLVYWAGGNPFHHHQQLNRLIEAWRRPELVVIHESWWNATARHADVVLPVTTFMERDDIVASGRSGELIASRRVCEPPGECRDDFAIFTGLAARLGLEESYTEGRDAEGWIAQLYEDVAARAAAGVRPLPDFERFWSEGFAELAPLDPPRPEFMSQFFADPLAHPLRTPSGKIELFSETVAGFNYDDCPGHPSWIAPHEWLGAPLSQRFPLHMLSNQPSDKLHSQWDHAALSRSGKVADRQRMRMNPADGAARGLKSGDVARVFNDRGAVLAGVELSADLRPGVIELPTGSWFDPLVPGEIGSLDKHGNPNVLTQDDGTSRLAQGPAPNTCLVEVEAFLGDVPPVTCFVPPPFNPRRL